MAEVTLMGASYSGVPAVELPQTGGGTVTFYEATDGNEIGYGITDGSIPIVGIAKAGYAHAWDSDYPMMKLGNGQIGIDRVV